MKFAGQDTNRRVKVDMPNRDRYGQAQIGARAFLFGTYRMLVVPVNPSTWAPALIVTPPKLIAPPICPA
jgi:hypothetical protein